MPASRFPCGGARSGLTWSEGGKRGRGRPFSPAAENPCRTQPRFRTETRPCLSRRFPVGVSATASAASGAVYTVGPRTPPPPPLPPSLHPSAVADSAAATSSAAASSLWSIFQPPNPEKQRVQPRRQETPPQLLGGPGGQSTGGFSAIEQQPLRSFCNPLPAPCPPRPSGSPAPSSHPLGRRGLSPHPVGWASRQSSPPPISAALYPGTQFSPPTMPRLSVPNFPLGISDHLQLARSTIHQTPPTERGPTLHYHLLYSGPPLDVRNQPILPAISKDRHQSNNAHRHPASEGPNPSDSLFLLVQRVTRTLNHWLSLRVRH